MARHRKLWVSPVLGLAVAALLSLPADTAPAGGHGKPNAGWSDTFDGNSLNGKRWMVSSWWAPGYRPDDHIGYYEPENVSVGGGYVSLRLYQEIGLVDTNPTGVISHGALIATKQKYGYGTYEWTMRMSSTSTSPLGPGTSTSGSVSAGFVYVNNSETEIDFEFSGQSPGTLYLVNWYNTNPATGPFGSQESFTPLPLPDVSSAFHTYRFVWEPGRISFYVDGFLQAVHTDNVPSAPAYFMINHWGTNSTSWGGTATVGTDRTMYIDRVSYTPLP